MVAENQISDLIQEKSKSEALKIFNSAKLGLIDTPEDLVSFRPGGMPIIYGILKRRVVSILRLHEITDKNYPDLLSQLEIDLAQTYEWVRAGSELHADLTDNVDDNIALSFFLELRERYSEISPTYYISYYLLSMIGIVDFEYEYLKSFGAPEDMENPEKAVVLLKASIDSLGALICAQLAADLGNTSYGKMSGVQIIYQQQSFLEQHAGAFNTEQGRKIHNLSISQKARRKWLPMILEMVSFKKERGVSTREACRVIGERHNEKKASIERQYYVWNKDRDNYLATI